LHDKLVGCSCSLRQILFARSGGVCKALTDCRSLASFFQLQNLLQKFLTFLHGTCKFLSLLRILQLDRSGRPRSWSFGRLAEVFLGLAQNRLVLRSLATTLSLPFNRFLFSMSPFKYYSSCKFHNFKIIICHGVLGFWGAIGN